MLMKLMSVLALGGDILILVFNTSGTVSIPGQDMLFVVLFFGGIGLMVLGNLLDEWQRTSPRHNRIQHPPRGPNTHPPF